MVAHIQGANLTQAVSSYEKELRNSAGLDDKCGVTSCEQVEPNGALVRFTKEVLSQAEQLEGRDLAVTKMSINMGKTSNDALGRLNPVEKMLFYHKGNLQARESCCDLVSSSMLRRGVSQGYEMAKDELMLFAPQRIHMEQLYVVLRREGAEPAAAAKAAVQKWVEGKDWKVVIA